MSLAPYFIAEIGKEAGTIIKSFGDFDGMCDTETTEAPRLAVGTGVKKAQKFTLGEWFVGGRERGERWRRALLVEGEEFVNGSTIGSDIGFVFK